MRTVILHGVATLAAGVAAGVAVAVLRPDAGPEVAGLAGAVVVLAGALAHEMAARRRAERTTASRLDILEHVVGTLAEDHGRRLAQLEEARGSGDGGQYETVIQEVKLLQSLVTRLTEKRRSDPPPAPLLTPQAPQPRAEEPPIASIVEAPPMDDALVLEAVRDALQADRIDIHLQPVVSLPQRKHRFYEAFSRVREPDGALILPDRYLDIAQREGLIATIDNLLLVRCVQLIRETEKRQHAIGFFSNISAATLSDADFMKEFLQLMAQNQALVPKLVFELSQEQLRAGGAVTLGILSQLARIGFRFSMDQVTDPDIDVETLVRHEFRYLKLDRALLLDPALAPRVEALRRRLDGEAIDVIVEKIETEEQMAELAGAGFDFGQGYLFGEPRPARRPA
ncbi:EAL domain-containing protein [Azospirillum rugosum]|uniref:Cyclic-di-GMP phosphodiesterase TipF (Flagellum assembly factor) n=1 Tax=Azospirillum rugosum TaxID=416170 RepID=A0ABS4SNY9_9PROT|nr:EAL domain-containing protein [Azospirillum rugosum]MBP2293080.1 cyclic-di-GMP phosphodiesterase TipF (flagellum assembly factor) [Azospirillum rugosum]MDQ0526629.1 cyclic-di-GMP phosphodiesterase TipF (flagellum assembly factor) [Azospirillum rugosum]